MLHPLDIVVAVKVALAPGDPGTIAVLASSLAMDHAQVYRALRGAVTAGLLHGQRAGHRVVYRAHHAALVEFLIHGARYVFPAVRGGATRGLATGHAAPVLAAHLAPSEDLAPVWPTPDGAARGESLQPLHRCVPAAARRDPGVYAVMALLDALRIGRARERQLAARLLPEVLRGRAA